MSENYMIAMDDRLMREHRIIPIADYDRLIASLRECQQFLSSMTHRSEMPKSLSIQVLYAQAIAAETRARRVLQEIDGERKCKITP